MAEEIKETTETVEQPKNNQLDSDTEEFIIEGQPLKLNRDQRARAVYLGLQKARELQEAAQGGKSKEDKPIEDIKKSDLNKKPEESNKEFDERIAKLEARLLQSQNTSDTRVMRSMIKAAEVDSDFHDEILTETMLQYAQAQSKGMSVAPDDVAISVINKWKKKLEKFGPRINVEEKVKDKKVTEKIKSGDKTAGQDEPKPLGRKSFRDGTLLQRVSAKYQKLLERSTE